MTLIDLLATPAYRDLSGEDALALASVPINTPRADRITITSLAAGEMWGFAKAAAFEAAMQAAADAGNASARTLLSMLRGGGFSPSDPQAASMAPAFVALGDGTIDDADAAKALYSGTTYPAGDAPPTLEDVQAARVEVARRDALAALRAAADAAWEPANTLHNTRGQKLSAILESGAAVPADLAALDAMEAD